MGETSVRVPEAHAMPDVMRGASFTDTATEEEVEGAKNRAKAALQAIKSPGKKIVAFSGPGSCRYGQNREVVCTIQFALVSDTYDVCESNPLGVVFADGATNNLAQAQACAKRWQAKVGGHGPVLLPQEIALENTTNPIIQLVESKPPQHD